MFLFLNPHFQDHSVTLIEQSIVWLFFIFSDIVLFSAFSGSHTPCTPNNKLSLLPGAGKIIMQKMQKAGDEAVPEQETERTKGLKYGALTCFQEP